MSLSIAVSGKGGSGKTTVAAMIVRHLLARGARGILAVDADPNACLGLALGVRPETTVADIRDQTLQRTLPGSDGPDRERAFEFALHRAVTEARGFDLLAMGRPEGPKCYCAVNNLLRKYLDEAGQDYPYLVIDNEAGMEHLSRRTTDDVDHLLVVTEATAVGALTARRILDLAAGLPIAVRSRGVLWNKAADPAAVAAMAGDLPTVGILPYDPAVLEASMRGRTIFELGAESPALRRVGELLDKLTGVTATPAS